MQSWPCLSANRKGITMTEFQARVNDDNPDPRVAVALLLDTSSSMSGAPIDALNEGYKLFIDEVSTDPLAKKRAEVTVITFGGTAEIAVPFSEGRDLIPTTFHAGGGTPMGAALQLALSELEAQKAAYRAAGLEYYRPWLFVITDGAPTDGPTFAAVAPKVNQSEQGKHVSVFSVMVGEHALATELSKLSSVRPPVPLKGLSFVELFSWLSASLSQVSMSDPPREHGADDDTQIPLPPISGWANA